MLLLRALRSDRYLSPYHDSAETLLEPAEDLVQSITRSICDTGYHAESLIASPKAAQTTSHPLTVSATKNAT